MLMLGQTGEKLRRTRRIEILIIMLVALAFGAGGFVATYLHDRSEQQLQSKYSLLSRRVLRDNPSDVLLNFRPLQKEYANYLQSNGLDDTVNLYFEYLPTGSSIGINEDKESQGASLLKLPMVVSFYKLVEQGKLSLDDKVTIKQEWLNDSYGELYKKGAGYQLTYREAIKYALEYSDNTAALAIFDALSSVEGTSSPSVLSFVDANYNTSATQEVLIGVQSYSSILKCLHFSCYLNKDDSQSILNDLSHSVANDRLALYTPSNLKIAHKIGTYGTQNQSDCGIVYVPKRNYVLCIMVQGQDPQASHIIGDLGQITYEYLKPTDNETQAAQ